MTNERKYSFGNLEKIAFIGSAVFFVISAFMIKSSGISVDSIISLQSTFLLETARGSFDLSPFISIILSFVFLTLGLAFLASYGYYKDNYRIGLSSVIGAISVIALCGITPLTLVFSGSLVIISTYIILLSNTYAKELKRWVTFRVGSHSIGKCFFIFNILIAVTIFAIVSANASYGDTFKENLIDTIAELSFGENPAVPPDQIEDVARQAIDESPLLRTYITYLPFIAAVGTWIFLEFFKSLVFTNIGGLFTYILIRVNRKIYKE